MKIDISDVMKSPYKEVQLEAQVDMDSFRSRLGDFPIHKKQPVMLQIVKNEKEELLISGTVDYIMDIPCARCLEIVPTPLHLDMERRVSLENGEPVDEEMENLDYLIGFEFDVDRFVYAEILVNWPMRVLCRKDCMGICKVCGMDLNKGTCSCRRTELDPRMAAIQNIFNKMKEV